MDTEHSTKFSNMLGIVKVTIEKGGSETVFEIHQDLLSKESTLLDKTLENEASINGLELPATKLSVEHTIASFEIFCQWLYRRSEALSTTVPDEDCLRAYLLGCYLQAPKFISACLDELQSRLTSEDADSRMLKLEKVVGTDKSLHVDQKYYLLHYLADISRNRKSDTSHESQDTLANRLKTAVECNASERQQDFNTLNKSMPVEAASKSSSKEMNQPSVSHASKISSGGPYSYTVPRIADFLRQYNPDAKHIYWSFGDTSLQSDRTDTSSIRIEKLIPRELRYCHVCKGGGIFDRSRNICATCGQTPHRLGLSDLAAAPAQLSVKNCSAGGDPSLSTAATTLGQIGNTVSSQPANDLFRGVSSTTADFGQSTGLGIRTNPQTCSGGLFGTTNNTQNRSLFGTTSNNATGRNLFGNLSNNSQNDGIFGSTPNGARDGGPFATASNSVQNGGLFGFMPQTNQNCSLFRNTSNNTQSTSTSGTNSPFGQTVQYPRAFGDGITHICSPGNGFRPQPIPTNTSISQGSSSIIPESLTFWSEAGHGNERHDYKTISAHSNFQNLSLEEMRYAQYMNTLPNSGTKHGNNQNLQSPPLAPNSNNPLPAQSNCISNQPQASFTPSVCSGTAQTKATEKNANSGGSSTFQDPEKVKVLEDKQCVQAQAIEQIQAQLRLLTAALEKSGMGNEQRAQNVEDAVREEAIWKSVKDNLGLAGRSAAKDPLDRERVVMDAKRQAGAEEEDADAHKRLTAAKQPETPSGFSTPEVIYTPTTSRSRSQNPMVIVCPDDDDDEEEEEAV